MFNKPKCNETMSRSGLPVPAVLANLESYDDLRERMKNLGWYRVFVKLAYGSSASGVVAIYINGEKVRAVTSMETIGSGTRAKFYNNLKLRIYHRELEVRRVVNFLCRETAHAEQWLPKSSLLGRVFDLRVVVIAGEATMSSSEQVLGRLPTYILEIVAATLICSRSKWGKLSGSR